MSLVAPPGQDGDEAIRAFEAWEKTMQQDTSSQVMDLPTSTTLTIQVIEARDVLGMDIGNTSDPYAIVILRNQRFRTDVKKSTLDPKWNQTFTAQIRFDAIPELVVEVWDKDAVGADDFLGQCFIDVARTLNGEKSTEPQWFPLLPQVWGGRVRGDIKLKLSVTTPMPLAPLDRTQPGDRKFGSLDHELSDLEGYQFLSPEKREFVKKVEQLTIEFKDYRYRLMSAFGIQSLVWKPKRAATDSISASNSRASSFFAKFKREMKQPIFSSSSSSSSSTAKSNSKFQWDVVLTEKTSAASDDGAIVQFNDLPDEVLISIFSNVSEVSRRTNRRVCKFWNDILKDEALQCTSFRAKGYITMWKNSQFKDEEVNRKAVEIIRELLKFILQLQALEKQLETCLRNVPANITGSDIQVFRSLISLARVITTLDNVKRSIPSSEFSELLDHMTKAVTRTDFRFDDPEKQVDFDTEKLLYWTDGPTLAYLRTFTDPPPRNAVDYTVSNSSYPTVELLSRLTGEIVDKLKSKSFTNPQEVAKAIDFLLGALLCFGKSVIRESKWYQKIPKMAKVLESYVTYINPHHLLLAAWSSIILNDPALYALYDKSLLVARPNYTVSNQQ